MSKQIEKYIMMLANSPYSDSDESISSGSSGVSGVSKICYKIYRLHYHWKLIEPWLINHIIRWQTVSVIRIAMCCFTVNILQKVLFSNRAINIPLTHICEKMMWLIVYNLKVCSINPVTKEKCILFQIFLKPLP